MIYHAVGERCALNLGLLRLPPEKTVPFLREKGFEILEIDLLKLARSYIGKSTYHRCALMREAPDVVDCASFIKWLFGQRGIWLPRDLLLWIGLGTDVPIEKLSSGDLIFTDGYTNRVVEEIGKVGHVALATDRGTVIHATNKVGVEEVSISSFLRKRNFCCARRILPENSALVTLRIPCDQEVETSNDVEWILFELQKE